MEGAAPNAPGNLTGLVTHNRATLNWDRPAGGQEITGYRIYRRNDQENPNGNFTLLWTLRPGTFTGKNDDNSMAGTREYSYKVAAVNDDGVSGRSNLFTALVPANSLSNADTWRSHSLTATRSGSNVTLNWEVISTTSVTGHKIRRKAVGARWETVVGNTGSGDRTYTDTNLTTGENL